MNKLIFTGAYNHEETIEWPLYGGESLQERLIAVAINEAATDSNAASLTAEVFFGSGAFIVEVYSKKDPVLACICGECAEANHYFTCEKCGQDIPWCRGADDQYPDLCDDCAVKEMNERNL